MEQIIIELIDKINAGDEQSFLDAFTEDGEVNDWGTVYRGRENIKTWSDREFIGAKGRMTPAEINANENVVTVNAGWKSSYFSGDSKFIFTLEGEKIKEMRIAAH